MNGKSTLASHWNWLASWPAKSVGAGSVDSGVNQPGVSPSAAPSAILALPAGVACAVASAASAPCRFAPGLVMSVT